MAQKLQEQHDLLYKEVGVEKEQPKETVKQKREERMHHNTEGDEDDTEIEKLVDKELEELIFLHNNQRGRRINIDDLRKEVAMIKQKSNLLQCHSIQNHKTASENID